MSTEENKAIARRTYDSFNEFFRTGNTASLERLVDTNIIDHNPARMQKSTKPQSGVPAGLRPRLLSNNPPGSTKGRARPAHGDCDG